MASPFTGEGTAFQVGSYFLKNYYQLLQKAPQLVHQFYNNLSSMVRLDTSTMESTTGSGMLEIHDIVTSLNIVSIEVKTANFMESWNGGILVMVYGLVQVKDYSARRSFVQSFFLAPQEKGYFVMNDIFKYLDYEHEPHHPSSDFVHTDYETKTNTTNAVTDEASNYIPGEEVQSKELTPVHAEESNSSDNYGNHEVQQVSMEQQVILDDTNVEDPIVPFQGSTNAVHDVPSYPEDEIIGEVPKTYASVLRTKGAALPLPRPAPNKANPGGSDYQTSAQPATQSVSQAAQLHEKSYSDTYQDGGMVDDEGEYLSVYVGNLSPSTSVFDLEQEFKGFGRIRPDGVAIRSRKEAGVFYGFVEFEDVNGVQNALKASPIQLHGRMIHVESRRPNSGLSRGGRRGRGGRGGYPSETSRGRFSGRSYARGSAQDQDRDYYANRSRGNGYQRRGGNYSNDAYA